MCGVQLPPFGRSNVMNATGLYIVIAIALGALSAFAEKGSFPPIENIGKHKLVFTEGDKTCGQDIDSYCEPAKDVNGLLDGACIKKPCDLECPERERKPDGSGAVPSIDVINENLLGRIRIDRWDNRGSKLPAYAFFNHPSCFTQPKENLQLGRSPSQFTLAVWMKQEYGNAGVIFEKVAKPGERYAPQVVLSIMVGGFSLVMRYFGDDFKQHMKVLSVPIQPNVWQHLTIQVYGRSVSVFLNGVGDDGTPVSSDSLDASIYDMNFGPIVKVGQRLQGTGQYVGRLQDYRWYMTALTNREIQEIYSGTFQELNIQSQCLCPAGYPRVHPLTERFCIPNGMPDTTPHRKLRLHEHAYPLQYLNDGDDSTYWISNNFYMRGGVLLTIDLENGEYEVFSINIQFYNPQPKMIEIFRYSNRTTAGNEMLWALYAEDCMEDFKYEPNGPLERPDSVNCIEFPSEDDIPFTNASITFSLLSEEPFPRPGKDEFYESPLLMDFVIAEKVEFRMRYQYHNLRHYVDIGHQLYAIREVEVIGRCNCHGHADACDMEKDPYECKCLPESNTGGNMCEECLPLFNNKPFKRGTKTESFHCQPCQCNSHADSCHYDISLDGHPDKHFEGGGGRCDNCTHHTEGIHCEMCSEFYFRMENVTLDDPNVCLFCNCSFAGAVNATQDCEKIDGQCDCKSKVLGRDCSICMDGYFNITVDNDDGCELCHCHLPGTIDRDFKCAQEGGQCNCKTNTEGRSCSECVPGFKNLQDSNVDGCEACNCHEFAAVHQYCNSTSGNCKCKDNIEGMHCDVCKNGFWKLPDSDESDGCIDCGCDESGTVPGTVCEKTTGQCVCKVNAEGRTCDTCKDIYFNLTESNDQGCENCHCDPRGTVNGSLVCDKTDGQCLCKENVEGRVCNECKGNTFGLDWDLDEGCEPCDCDPTGTQKGDGVSVDDLVCHATTGQCACVSHREGRQCDECQEEYYLPQGDSVGCLACDCHPYSSTSDVCNNATGQCPCKNDAGVTGRDCRKCDDTFWNFNHLFGSCQECGCDERGSINATCNVVTGECKCKGNVIGDKCDQCREGSSRLTLHNPMGCYSHPEQQAPPIELRITSSSIDLQWSPPDLPNGDELAYELYRNNELIYEINVTYPFDVVFYNDTDLLPYTDYDYHIVTSNIGGNTESAEERFKTDSGIPTGVPPLEVSDIKSTEATFNWKEPDVAHGPIEKYVLQSINTVDDHHQKEHYSGMDLSVTIDDLKPFFNYTFTLRACTSGGCGDSMPLVVITPEAKPEKQSPPTITSLSNSSLLIEWTRPDEPNGVLTSYKVLWRGKPDENGIHYPMQAVAFEDYGQDDPRPKIGDGYMALEQLETNFTIDDLQPFTEYQFLVSSANSVGTTESSWETGRTLEGTPVFMGKPRAWAISSSQINISWVAPDPVTEIRGNVKMYQVVWVKQNTDTEYNVPPKEDVVLYSTGPKRLAYLAKNLDPYKDYTLFINLCNSVGCVESERITVKTLPAAPEDQKPPVQVDQETDTISISWDLPGKVNGPHPDFTLFRSPVSFSRPPTEMSRGIRFPGHSYLRYSPETLPKDAAYSGIQLKFRTFQENALLFFAASRLASDYTRHEYLVIQLQDGRPWFLFDLQNSPTSATIDDDDIDAKYNDGKWHRIEINRFEKEGFIELDGIFTGSATARSHAIVYGESEDIYLAGLPSGYNVARPNDRGTMKVITTGFVGCMKDISVQRSGMLQAWSNVTFEDATNVHRAYDSWQGCPDILDGPAGHFLGRGYLKMKKPFNISNSDTWSIRMQIRPAFSSGIIFFAGGRNKNFVMGTMNNATLRFVVSMVHQSHEMTFDPKELPSFVTLCDGNWHSVEFRNNRGTLTMTLDEHLQFGPTMDESFKGIDLSQSFFLGGVEEGLSGGSSFLIDFFEDDGKSFGGCMRSFQLDLVEHSFITESDVVYNVDLDGCPTGASNSHVLLGSGSWNQGSSGMQSGVHAADDILDETYESSQNCETGSLKVLYEGHDMEFNSSNSHAFTQYLYRVMASNDGGDTRSKWKVMRSGEGIPKKVGSPYDVKHISGYAVEVFWRRPYQSNGVIVNYILSAISLGDSAEFNSTLNVTGEYYSGNITGLDPWSQYEVYLSACTVVGCTKSTASLPFTTNEEAPYFVQKPSASVKRTTMVLTWSQPLKPNGIVLNYTLYHNNSKIYSGTRMQRTVRGLATFQQQRFKVEACTIAGCNMSEEVTVHSAQLPPGHVDPPMLRVLGPNSMSIEWLQPAVLNGIFDRYVIYVSNEQNTLGTAVYNSTEPQVETELHDLIAGMDYYVTLETCTGGGCKRSSQTFERTTESVPEDIPKTGVISRSPYSFDVNWTAPVKPNGVITNYTLYMDDMIMNVSTKPSSIHIEKLFPHGRHTFRVRVCTLKGCAYSPLAVHRTQESKPEGDVTVDVTVVDARSIDVKWNMPMKRNGVMSYRVYCTGQFFVDRDGGNFRGVYETRNLHVGDRADQWTRIEGLLPYTDYMVQVNASNSKGYIMSNMRTIRMPPGAPDGVMPPSMRSISPYELIATWTDPVRNNAPGNAYFQLQYRSVAPLEIETNAFDERTRQMSYSLKDLKPNEEYEFRLNAINNYGNTFSEWVSARTQQTAPSFMAKPHVFDLDATSMSLRWRPPTNPNGKIQSYKIYDADRLIATLPSNKTYYLIEDLEPFTFYNYVIEVCTDGGCTRSDVTRIQTTASAPEGLSPPDARSESPTSVFVTWKPPKVHNGILDNYVLERRLFANDEQNESNSDVTVLGSFVPSQSLRYLDDATLLEPFTIYQYRVVSSTIGGGLTASNWTTVTTRPGRPAGIYPPVVTLLSPHSAQVDWEEPELTNGPIIRYEVLFPEPRYTLEGNANFTLTVMDLIPFTEYQVSVIACTDGGCSESPTTDRTTDTTVPEQLEPPSAIPVSESYISVQWKPPKFPNGPGIFYELTRTKKSQPLVVPPPNDIDIPVTVYKGSYLSFQDQGLEMHTTFIYTLACFNIEGSVTSNETEVVTLGGIPLRAPTPRLMVLNHTSIRVVWDEPSIYDIQGEVDSYEVECSAEGDSRRVLSLLPNQTSIVLGDLLPGMIYSIQLTVDNGAHRVASEIVEALTKDGAPEGVMPPVVYSLSASELHCSWLAPSNPNGEVIGYYMYVDNLKIDMETDTPSSYVLSDLIPFTVYNLQIEACTKYACTKSDITKATTQETLPDMLENPIAKILGARKIEVSWIPPKKPNGILKSYEIHRRSIVPCKDIEPKDDSKHCAYINCKKNERPCGNTCYSPSTKVCCDGNIFFKSGGYECCGGQYIRSSTNSSDVCCAGKFYSALSTYQCCGNRYVQVLPREVCCQDVEEDRVSVGAGDTCCGDIPYFSNGVQVCCNGELHNGFKKKCCGDEVINADRICCGTENARSYDEMQNHECCGNTYISTSSAVCCRDAITREESVHSFDSNRASRNQTKCCSTQLISSESNCCNGRGYDSMTHVCADFGTISSDDHNMRCGSGTVCSINQTPSSFCDRCDFDIDRYDCYVSRGLGDQLKESTDHSSMCTTSFMMVHTGSVDVFSFMDETVEPYTKYEYKLLASNKMGFSESGTVAVTTFQSVPKGVEPPEWTSNSEDAIMLSWKEPRMPNGKIIKYALVRDGLEIWQGLAFAQTDTFQILSFKRYVYELKACTFIGCSSSPQIFATSIQGIPTEVLPPLVSVKSPTNISITWKHPSESNGLVIKYTLNETGVGTIFKIDPVRDDSSLSFVHSDLVPHSQHTYMLAACTIAGCQSSKEVSVTTFEDVPSGVWNIPAVLVINMTMAEVFWRPPEKPNGIIREYRLLRREVNAIESVNEDALEQHELIYQGGPEQLTYTDNALQAGRTYEYVLWAINTAGVGKSKPHRVRTPAKVPSQIPTLDVRITGSNTLLTTWSLNSEEVEETYTYSVIVQLEDMTPFVNANRRKKRSIGGHDTQDTSNTGSGNTTDPPLLIYSVGKNQTFIVEKLSPYTLYRVRVRTCIPGDEEDVNCITGEENVVRTMPAPPDEQLPPKLKAIGPRAVDIMWDPPKKKNGIITQYQIYRRNPDAADSSKVIFSTGDTERNWYMDSDEDELMPYTTYEYRVRVRNSEGFAESDWTEVTTLQDKPEGIGTPSVIAISAYSVRVLWSEPEQPNGQIISYSLEYRDEPDDPTDARNNVEIITVPSSQQETYISGLKPFTRYEVRLVVLNSAGMEARNDWVSVKTYPSPPSGLGNFSVVAMEDGRSLLLTWNPPSEPNGEITTYNIYEEGYDTPLQTGLFRQFHLRRLKPYTKYTLRLEACTGYNLCTMSPPQTFMTAQTLPELQPPPTISMADTTAVTLFWTRPKEANGVILSYKVIRNEMPRLYFASSHARARRSIDSDFLPESFMDFNGLDWMRSSLFTSRARTRVRRSDQDITYDSDGSRVIYEVVNPSEGMYNYTDTNLKPYSKYEYKIRTSTSAGHIDSDWVTAETHQAAPAGLSAPHIDYTPDSNPTQLVVMWTLPEQVNGILQTFRIRRNGSTPFSFPANQFQFTDRGLQPYTVYSYSVTACTSGGCTESDINSERTLEEAPLFVSAPIIKTVNSSALHVTWVAPTITNGVIRQYQVFIDDQKLYEGNEMETTITDLAPYAFYTIHIAACTSSGCRKSDGRVARTSEAPPLQMEAPELHVTSSRSIEVNWDPPMQENGKIVRYELRRNNELIAVTDGDIKRYHDFDLHPGTTYQYFLTAFNKVGHVKGDVAAEMTDPAAPAGLKPPDLLPTSSSSIHAYWKAPSNPNGIIVNFTLHIRNVRDKNDEKIIKLPGNVYEYVVRGLLYYQDYSFWIQCCTKLGCATSERAQQRTLEGIPRSLRPPYASLQEPDDVMLYVSWDLPSKPNGIITRYELYRRMIIETQSAIEAVQGTMVYNGSAQMFVDRELEPYSKYQYRVKAFNSAGNVWSGWSSVTRTGEAAPEKMAAPSFGQITERTVQVLAAEPAVLNGIIRSYTVYTRKNMSSSPFQQVTTGYGRDQTAVGLTPFTPYEFRVEACTLEHLCLTSSSSYSATMPAAPKGQGAPQIVNIASTNVTLRWSAPAEANGIINSYEVHARESCPSPYQPYKQECHPGPATISYFGISQQATILHLLPYQAYEFSVVSVNDYGRSKSEWAAERTLKAKPEYVHLPRVTSNISSIYIVWRNTFHLNSILVQFELTDRGERVYAGFQFSRIIRRTAAMMHEFQVKVTTDTGTAVSPKIMHDTGRGSSVEVDEDKPEESDDTAVAAASVPVYETIWFIAVIVLFSILLVFTALGVFLRRAGASQDDHMKSPPPFPGPAGFVNGSSHSHGEFKLRRNPSHHSIHSSSEPDLRFMDFGEFHNDAFQQDWPMQDDASIRTVSDLMSTREKYPLADTHL